MPAVSDIEIEPGREAEAALPQVSAARTGGVGLRAPSPGRRLGFCTGRAGHCGGPAAPVVGAAVIAILCGIVIALVKKPSTRLKPGIVLSSKTVLQGSIVLLGSGSPSARCSRPGYGRCQSCWGPSRALGMAWLAGRLLGLRGDLRTLVGIGTAVCGASAIAATDAVIDADEADVSYAVATIFTFNVVAVLCYPSLGHVFGFSGHTFGLWAGTAINDLSSVVAASTVYGHAAASYGVIVKLDSDTRHHPHLPRARRHPGTEAREDRRGDFGTAGRAASYRAAVHPGVRGGRGRQYGRSGPGRLAPPAVGPRNMDDHRRPGGHRAINRFQPYPPGRAAASCFGCGPVAHGGNDQPRPASLDRHAVTSAN